MAGQPNHLWAVDAIRRTAGQQQQYTVAEPSWWGRCGKSGKRDIKNLLKSKFLYVPPETTELLLEKLEIPETRLKAKPRDDKGYLPIKIQKDLRALRTLTFNEVEIYRKRWFNTAMIDDYMLPVSTYFRPVLRATDPQRPNHLRPVPQALHELKFIKMRIQREEASLFSGMLLDQNKTFDSLTLDRCKYGFRESHVAGILMNAFTYAPSSRKLVINYSNFSFYRAVMERMVPPSAQNPLHDREQGWTLDLSHCDLGDLGNLKENVDHQRNVRFKATVEALMRYVTTLKLNDTTGDAALWLIKAGVNVRHLEVAGLRLSSSTRKYFDLQLPSTDNYRYDSAFNPFYYSEYNRQRSIDGKRYVKPDWFNTFFRIDTRPRVFRLASIQEENAPPAVAAGAGVEPSDVPLLLSQPTPPVQSKEEDGLLLSNDALRGHVDTSTLTRTMESHPTSTQTTPDVTPPPTPYLRRRGRLSPASFTREVSERLARPSDDARVPDVADRFADAAELVGDYAVAFGRKMGQCFDDPRGNGAERESKPKRKGPYQQLEMTDLGHDAKPTELAPEWEDKDMPSPKGGSSSLFQNLRQRRGGPSPDRDDPNPGHTKAL